MAAYAKHLAIDALIVGKPMGFWKGHMPSGMYLRSACDWHLDPMGMDTIEKYLETKELRTAEVEPLSIGFYLSYAQWFQERKNISALPAIVQGLEWKDGKAFPFRAGLDNGETIAAKFVVVAVGFEYFKHVPPELAGLLPEGRYSHTCDFVDFEGMRGKRCLIVGGRQSAFEWAALLHEAGAAEVHVSHRHDSPEFAVADWSWVNPLVDGMAENPGWFRGLTQQEKDAVSRRLWAEGRLKVEPWLKARILQEGVMLWPRTQITDCVELATGDVATKMDNGQEIAVDHIILATGYKVNIARVPFLAQSNILAELKTSDGFPELGEDFESSIPGLFITSMPAGQQFGPFFGFTIAVRTSARLIGEAIVRRLELGCPIGAEHTGRDQKPTRSVHRNGKNRTLSSRG